MVRSSFALLAVLGLGCAFAQAQTVIEDFEAGTLYDTAWAGAGDIVADPDDPGNMVLDLNTWTPDGVYIANDRASFDLTAVATGAGTLSVDIYDNGNWQDGSNAQGFRFGIVGDVEFFGHYVVHLTERTYFDSQNYYYLSDGTQVGSNTLVGTETIYTGTYNGNLTRTNFVDQIDTDDTAGIDPATDGAWTTWSFVLDGAGMLTDIVWDNGTTSNNAAGYGSFNAYEVGVLQSFGIAAGRQGQINPMSAVLMDNLTWTPAGPSFIVGDMNDDGVIDNLDINPFVLALTNPAQYQTDFGLDPNGVGDINDDGVLDNLDINPFVALLTGPAAGTAVPEPASLALIGLGGLALLRRRR